MTFQTLKSPLYQWVLHFFITHILSFQNNLYKKYFKRFKSSKNNAIWHIITLLYVIGSFIAFYKSLFY